MSLEDVNETVLDSGRQAVWWVEGTARAIMIGFVPFLLIVLVISLIASGFKIIRTVV